MKTYQEQSTDPTPPLTAHERALVARLQARIDKAIAERTGEPTLVILNHIKRSLA